MLATAVVVVIRQLAAMLVQEGAGTGVTAVVLVICQLAAMLVQEGAGAGVTAVILVSRQLAAIVVQQGAGTGRSWGTNELSASCHVSTGFSRSW